jgi:hypothetical protein
VGPLTVVTGGQTRTGLKPWWHGTSRSMIRLEDEECHHLCGFVDVSGKRATITFEKWLMLLNRPQTAADKCKVSN